MVTTLYLVRHGETEGSELKRYCGSMDVQLSEKGVRQMRAASGFIIEHLVGSSASRSLSYLRDIHGQGGASNREAVKNPRLSAIYSSDLRRAVRSAEIIAERHAVNPVRLPALRERSFGIWEGMTFAEIKEKYPSEFDAWAGNPVSHSPMGGENTLAVAERVTKALEEIISRHRGENVSIVAHGGVNRIILCDIMGVPLENIFRIEQDHAAVSIIEFWERYPVVKLMNRGFHG